MIHRQAVELDQRDNSVFVHQTNEMNNNDDEAQSLHSVWFLIRDTISVVCPVVQDTDRNRHGDTMNNGATERLVEV